MGVSEQERRQKELDEREQRIAERERTLKNEGGAGRKFEKCIYLYCK